MSTQVTTSTAKKPFDYDSLRELPLTITQVGGSTAGSGSGDFHKLRAQRNAEFKRVTVLEQKAKEEKEQAEFEARKRDAEEEVNRIHDKNAEKRKRKKENRQANAKKRKTAEPESSQTNNQSVSHTIVIPAPEQQSTSQSTENAQDSTTQSVEPSVIAAVADIAVSTENHPLSKFQI